jgi:hypothetical protein
MTTKEFSNEFDIHYNSISSNQAPGLDLYEKSVFLSKAQLELVKSHFGLGNKYKEGFEQSNKRRVDLNQLITTHTSTSLGNNLLKGLHSNSIFFPLAVDTMFIINETAKLISSDSCVNGEYVKVVPKTHDEYNIQINNPFKKPDKSVVWRLDHSNLNVGIKNVELITSEDGISEYKVRYVKYPSPIILTNLDDAFPGEGLSIDNIKIEQTCKLDESFHREILDRAIELATMDYKMQELQARTQINLRNE